MSEKHWNSVEEMRHWHDSFRGWLFALMELIEKHIHDQHTDTLLPEGIIIDRCISALRKRADFGMLIDSEFRSSINARLREIAKEIAACETAHGQGATRERRIIEDAARDFSVMSMIE